MNEKCIVTGCNNMTRGLFCDAHGMTLFCKAQQARGGITEEQSMDVMEAIALDEAEQDEEFRRQAGRDPFNGDEVE